MTKSTYLNRYYAEEDLFTVYVLSEEETIRTKNISILGEPFEVSWDTSRAITSINTDLRNIGHNELLITCQDLGINFKAIELLPTYKLKNVKGSCIIKHNASNKFYYF